jgi:peroxiredoxin
LVVISREETEVEVTEFLTANGYTFPAAADTECEIYSQFATESIPRTFVIAPDGAVAYATIGFSDGDEKELERTLNDLLDALPNGN